MLLVGQANKLSDRELALYVWETLSARHFCELAMEDCVPDHSTLSRFRTRLVAVGAWGWFAGNRERSIPRIWDGHHGGAIVDASLTTSPYAPKGGGRTVVVKDPTPPRTEDVHEVVVYHTTAANEHNSKGLVPLIQKVRTHTARKYWQKRDIGIVR